MATSNILESASTTAAHRVSVSDYVTGEDWYPSIKDVTTYSPGKYESPIIHYEDSVQIHERIREILYKLDDNNNEIPKRKGVEIMTMYQVNLVYGEDRKDPLIFSKYVVADSPDDAKVKCGLMKEVRTDWDMDFVTFIVTRIGEVAVKERPTETKSV